MVQNEQQNVNRERREESEKTIEGAKIEFNDEEVAEEGEEKGREKEREREKR